MALSEGKHGMDIIKIIRECVKYNEDYMCNMLKKALIITEERRNENKPAYGFEWLIHVLLASYLIEKRYTVHTGTQYPFNTKKKVDLVIDNNSNCVLIEIKTIEKYQLCWIKEDIKKLKGMQDREKYILVVGYPDERSKEKLSDEEGNRYLSNYLSKGIKLVNYFRYCEKKFRFYVLKVSST